MRKYFYRSPFMSQAKIHHRFHYHRFHSVTFRFELISFRLFEYALVLETSMVHYFGFTVHDKITRAMIYDSNQSNSV